MSVMNPAGRRSFPEPKVDHLEPVAAHRVLMTVSCRDTDFLPKVDGAGSIVTRDGLDLQIMHNGLLIERGCYYGPWMDEIITALGGHHEPQEEAVFARVIERLHDTGGAEVMIEFGSFWAYYSMWFASEFDGATVIDLEPDPAYLDVGRRNAALNGLEQAITFGQGAVGERPGEDLDFVAESDGRTYAVPQYDLASTMQQFGVDHVDLLMVDIQGAEQILLPRARPQFAAGQVRFLIVSTHHHLISGNATTHQDMLRLLTDAGGHVIAEHSVPESFSGDGLIAVSFDPRDADFTVEVSHARAKQSLFGELEPELAGAQREVAALRQQVADERAARSATQAELDRVQSTRLWRWAAGARGVYGRLRAARRSGTAGND